MLKLIKKFSLQTFSQSFLLFSMHQVDVVLLHHRSVFSIFKLDVSGICYENNGVSIYQMLVLIKVGNILMFKISKIYTNFRLNVL